MKYAITVKFDARAAGVNDIKIALLHALEGLDVELASCVEMTFETRPDSPPAAASELAACDA